MVLERVQKIMCNSGFCSRRKAEELIGDGKVIAKLIEGSPLASLEYEIVDVEPGTRGDTAHGGVTKPAVLSNGMKVQVPLFVKQGERIRVSTRDGKFVERVR